MNKNDATVAAVSCFLAPIAESWYQMIGENDGLKKRNRAINSIKLLADLDVSEDKPLVINQMFQNNPESLAVWYDVLSDYLIDSDNARFVLYFPFSWLPAADWGAQTDSEKLAIALNRFISIYLSAWKQTLLEVDFRHDFSNGDLIESDDMAWTNIRVVKAGHLLPVLMEKNLISREKITRLIAQSSRPETAYALSEGLRAWGQLNQLVPDNYEGRGKLKSWPEILEEISQEIAYGHQQLLAYEHITPRSRTSWEKEVVIDRAIARQTKHLQRLEKAYFIEKYFNDENLRLAWDKLWLHLNFLEKPGREEWPFKKDLPKLYLKFSLDGIGSRMTDGLRAAADKISHIPELSELIYPVILLYGSQVKGYKVSSDDSDIAIFIRESVDFSERTRIHKLWSDNFSNQFPGIHPLQIWLKAKKEKLVIHAPIEHKLVASEDSIHVILGAAWCGPMEIIEELRDRIISQYLQDAHNPIKRRFWLKILERDFLQYRLLHKGYHHFFPAQGRIRMSGINDIDAYYAFWDEGYRKLATELFVRKVFLPII